MTNLGTTAGPRKRNNDKLDRATKFIEDLQCRFKWPCNERLEEDESATYRCVTCQIKHDFFEAVEN